MDDRIQLKFWSVSEILGTEEIGLLILTDVQETRQLAIPCDIAIINQIRLRLGRASVVGRLLPEVLWHVISTNTSLQFEIVITDIIEGQYRASLVNRETLDPVAIRISDGILLAFIAQLPISIDSRLMEKQSVPFQRESPGVAIPVNTISTEMLKSALEKAIEEEKYELASHLRDELRRRKE